MWHTVLSYVEDGKRIEKWKTTGLPLANYTLSLHDALPI